MKNGSCVPKIFPIVTWVILTCCLENFKDEYFDIFRASMIEYKIMPLVNATEVRMIDIKTLTSMEQMILDELRDIRKILDGKIKDSNPTLDEINARLANIESLLADKVQQKTDSR